jgi:hypothetical protein
MKQLAKITPVAAALALTLGASSVQAESKLSVSGFIDMSYVTVDTDGAGSETSSGIDQIEVNLGYDLGNKLSANVSVEYQDNGTGEEVDVEEAFLSYAVSDQLSVKAGRFLSYTGWETEEPTGLFQFSGTGYAQFFYGGYQQGVSAYYDGKGYALAVSIVNDLGDLEGEARDSSEPGIETMLALTPTEDITIKGFYSQDKLAGTSEDTTLVNIWASYAPGPLTLAVEYNTSENAPAAVGIAGLDADASGFLVMGNYAFDKFGLTLRYHEYDIETAAGVTVEDNSAITISPSYTVSDNLLMVFEYRMDSNDITGVDSDLIAIEALVTF